MNVQNYCMKRILATGVVKIYEQGSNRKDRYTSCSYGSYFFDQLELDLDTNDSNYDFACLIN